MAKILSIIVTYNASQWLESCIGSIVNSDIPVDLAVVDNASRDDTVSMINEKYIGDIKYFYPLDDNLGFGGAHNLVFSDCDLSAYDYIFLLNQDAEISSSGISALVKVAGREPSLGIVSPIHYYSEGVMDRSFSKYYKNTLNEKIIVDGEDVAVVEFVNAAIWLFRTDILAKVGMFNPMFQHYGEDTNFVQRLHIAGYKVGVVENVVGFHYRPQDATGLERRSMPDRFYLKSKVRLLNPSDSLLKTVPVLCVRAGYNVCRELLNRDIKNANKFFATTSKLLKELPDIHQYRNWQEAQIAPKGSSS